MKLRSVWIGLSKCQWHETDNSNVRIKKQGRLKLYLMPDNNSVRRGKNKLQLKYSKSMPFKLCSMSSTSPQIVLYWSVTRNWE